jgi:hypothetical protein
VDYSQLGQFETISDLLRRLRDKFRVLGRSAKSWKRDRLKLYGRNISPDLDQIGLLTFGSIANGELNRRDNYNIIKIVAIRLNQGYIEKQWVR